jgi:hypothetical protein
MKKTTRKVKTTSFADLREPLQEAFALERGKKLDLRITKLSPDSKKSGRGRSKRLPPRPD